MLLKLDYVYTLVDLRLYFLTPFASIRVETGCKHPRTCESWMKVFTPGKIVPHKCCLPKMCPVCSTYVADGDKRQWHVVFYFVMFVLLSGAAVDSTVSEPEQQGHPTPTPAHTLRLLHLSGQGTLVNESLSQWVTRDLSYDLSFYPDTHTHTSLENELIFCFSLPLFSGALLTLLPRPQIISPAPL